MKKEQNEKIHQPDGKVFKALLQSKKAFMQLVWYFLSENWGPRIDEQSLMRVDKSFILQDYAGREADIVYQCKVDGQDVVFYVLLELQSTVDQQMPWRLLQYMVEIWRNERKENNERNEDNEQSESKLPRECETTSHMRTKKFRLPAIIPIVLYNGLPIWTARRSFREYQNGHELFGDSLVDFRYQLIDVKRWNGDLTAMEGILPLTLHLESARDADELLSRLEKIMDALFRLSEEETGLMQTYIRRILSLIVNGSAREAVLQLADSLKGDTHMISSAVEMMREEMKRLKLVGREEGRQEGMEEGREVLRKVIVSMRQNGLDRETIAKLTRMPLNEIEELSKADSIA